MTVTPGAYAPTVTQWVLSGSTTDSKNNKVATFTSRAVTALAEYPGNALESDTAAGDVITADRILLFSPNVPVSEYDEFTISDGNRYRVDGAPGRYVNPGDGTAITQVNLRRIS